MLLELLEAVEFGKEVGGIAQGFINGDHYDAVDKAISMCDAIDYNAPTWREEINEILDTISCVNKDDRAFVRAAATYIRACCYFDLGNYAKSRQSISECSMISVDSWTINKDVILDFQKRAKELRKEIDKQNYSQEIEPELEQIQKPVIQKSYSRKELLDIIAKCNNTSAYYVTEDSFLNASNFDLLSRLENWYNIKIANTQCNSVNTYRGLIDIILSPPVQGEDIVDCYSLPFSMPIEDIFNIEGRGVVITGTIVSGRVRVGDVIYLVQGNTVLPATVLGCEMFRKLLEQAEYGDNVGLLLKGVSKEQVKRGMMATAIKPVSYEPQSTHQNTSNDGEDVEIQNASISVQQPNQSCPSLEEQEFLEEFKECLADGEIGPGERRLLDKLASKLGISPERASELEASLSTPVLTDDEKEYYEEVHAVLSDGEISDKERRLLEKLRKMLGISEERAKEIEAFAEKK